MPFEIPESWVWCQFGEYLDVRDGTHDSPKYVDKGFPFVTSKNLNNGRIDFSTAKFISEEDHINFSQRSFVEDGDILFAMIGSIGNPVLVVKDREFSIKNVALFKPYNRENTYMDYVLYYLHYIQESLRLDAKGGMQPFIPLNYFRRDLMIPIPPLNEQKRIVSELQKLIAHIDEVDYEATGIKVDINKTKSKILELAISGKLVPQDPNDEPAIELLKRINPGLEPCDNSHYENLPQGWVKLRLGDVCSFERGITFPSSAKCTIKQSGMIACIRTANVQDNLELDDLWYVGNEYIKGNTEKLVRKNDIIMSSANSRELVGKVSYVHDLTEQMTFGGFVLNIRANEGILPFFLFLMLRALYLKGYYLTIATQTTNIANLNTKILGDIEVLLPPLTEQERIINYVTNILASIENITAELS